MSLDIETPPIYVVTGATAKTGGAVARGLLDHGAKVRVVGRSLDRLQPLIDKGAEPYMADPSDPASMCHAFDGASVAWIMLQPNYIADSQDFRGYQTGVIAGTVPALERSSVRHVVNLSSWGADKADGTGPVVGLHDMEQALERIPDLNVLHLRAGYFMENSLSFATQLLAGDVVSGPFDPNLPMPLVATRDVGTAAVSHLLASDFKGRQVRELQGERDLSMTDMVAIIGTTLGRPGLRYLQSSREHARAAMLQAGISPNVAALMMEVIEGINGRTLKTTQPRTARTTTPTRYELFVSDVWLPAYLRLANLEAERIQPGEAA